MAEYIERETALAFMNEVEPCICHNSDGVVFTATKDSDMLDYLRSIPAADVVPVPEGGIGEMSDGYHTFNGLYYQRMVLFAALVNAHNDKAWKSWKHEDGSPCFNGGWFIVGIDTPQGSYTYHYEDKYWNWFECEELPVAKHWDGHTEEDVTRLLSLDIAPVRHGRWILDDITGIFKCSECDNDAPLETTGGEQWCSPFCHSCGARMDGDGDDNH